MRLNGSHLFLVLSLVAAIGVVNAQAPGGRKSSRRPAAKRTTTLAPEELDEVSEDCPEPNGYFADDLQCDKYYECINGRITEKLCPDGQVFNDFSIEHEKCDLPVGIDCTSRPALQEPQPSLHCKRKHGYFPHEDSSICNKFYFCVDGMFNMYTCPDGLVFNEKIGICSWPADAQKKGCSSKDLVNFTCPAVPLEVGQTHPRYADVEDCQFFYVCIDGVTPRRNGCKRGQVFNDSSKNCDWPRHVPECADWYKGIITDEELERLENPKPARPKQTTTPQKTRPGSRRRPQEE